MNAQVKQTLMDRKLISIIRGISPEQILPVIAALIQGNIHCIEITLNTPGALQMIQKAKEHYGSQITIGAGTVLDKASAVSAIFAGADFLLSPLLDTEVIETCNAYSRASVPGVATPTEAFTAWKAGADIIKLFPAASLGSAYIKNLKGPLDNLDIMAVGGISLNNIREFYTAGASCFGIGSELINSHKIQNHNYSVITQAALQFQKQLNMIK